MFSQPVRFLALDNVWSDSFTVLNPLSGDPLDLTIMSAKTVFRPFWHCHKADWYSGSYEVIASTDTGEIINGGMNGTFSFRVSLRPGIYKVRGDASFLSFAMPFLNGQLSISRDGFAQMAINPIENAVVLANDGGVVTIVGGPSGLPTSLPSQVGALWDNGGVLSLSDGGASILPNTLPDTPGVPWNNGGVVSIS